jgi:hypothetical protein
MMRCRLLGGLLLSIAASSAFNSLDATTWDDGIKEDPRYTVMETLTPASCFAGEPFHIQPLLTIYEEATGKISVSFDGDIYASMESGPTGYEVLRNNGTASLVTENAVPVYGGIATFETLTLNEAGRGYKLRYVARRRLKTGVLKEVAEVEGGAFEVALNDP